MRRQAVCGGIDEDKNNLGAQMTDMEARDTAERAEIMKRLNKSATRRSKLRYQATDDSIDERMDDFEAQVADDLEASLRVEGAALMNRLKKYLTVLRKLRYQAFDKSIGEKMDDFEAQVGCDFGAWIKAEGTSIRNRRNDHRLKYNRLKDKRFKDNKVKKPATGVDKFAKRFDTLASIRK